MPAENPFAPPTTDTAKGVHDLGAVARPAIRMPVQVKVVVGLVAALILPWLLSFLDQRSPPAVGIAGLSVTGLILFGLLRRHPLAWQWGMIMPTLGSLSMALGLLGMFLRLPSRPGAAQAIVLLLLLGVQVAIPILLGLRGSRIFYGLSCPRCHEVRAKAASFLFGRLRCASCGALWRSLASPVGESSQASPTSPPLLVLLALLALGGPLGCGTTSGYRFPKLPRPEAGATMFVVFDAGQADAMLVLHRGHSMLVDAGSSWRKRARQNFRNIARRLEALTGQRRLDYLVVSHYHQDHIGLRGVGKRASLGNLGLWGLLADEKVKVDVLIDRGFLALGPKGNTQRAYETSLSGWLASGAVGRRVAVKAGQQIDMGGELQVEVIAVNGNRRLLEVRAEHPELFDHYPPSENDYSIALKFTQGDFELFSAGDLSGEDVLRSYGPMRLSYNDIESGIAEAVGPIEVYKVTHHGSNHSSNDCLIRVLRPQVAVISTGENSYEHPSLRVYRALSAISQVYITGGADRRVEPEVGKSILGHDVEILVAPDGRRYWVEGREMRSFSEAEERARKDYRAACQPKHRLPPRQLQEDPGDD